MFGTFDFRVDKTPIEGLLGDRTKSILGRLLLSEGKSIQRSILAEELWPEGSVKQSRTNLRRELHTLRNRHAIFRNYLSSDTESVVWSESAEYEFDVDSFNHIYNCFSKAKTVADRLDKGEELLASPYGVLLPGHTGEWIEDLRDSMSARWLYVAEELLSIYKKNKQVQDAIKLANEVVVLHPHRESVFLQLMQLHLLQGNNAIALQTYHHCATVLRDELGVVPSNEIQSLYARLSKISSSQAGRKITSKSDSERSKTELFAGRVSELNSISSLVHLAEKTAKSHIVLISGVAGIGKTRLATEWVKNNKEKIDYFGKARCFEGGGSQALGPIYSWLRNDKAELLFSNSPSDEAQLVKSAFVAKDSLSDEGVIKNESSSASRQRLFDALAVTFKSEAIVSNDIKHKRVFFLDDLQWCDQDTLDLLEHILNFSQGRDIVFLATVRSENSIPGTSVHNFVNRLVSRGQLNQITVDNLDLEDSKYLASSVFPRNSVSVGEEHDLITNQICERAEGHPLFIVEMARFEFDSQDADKDEQSGKKALPPRIEAVIQQRLKQLSTHAALVASYAAVLGSQFSVQLLGSVEKMEQEPLVSSMDELWQKRIISQTPNGQYVFSHDYIREVCYQMLPAPQRQLLHSQVSHALESFHQNHYGSISTSIAYHSKEAGDYERAYQWYFQALEYGKFSIAYNDVIDLCDATIKLVQENNINIDRDLSIFRLLLFKSQALATLEGYGSANLGRVCDQLESLSANVGDLELRAKAIDRIRVHHSFSNNLERALKYTDDQIHIARSLPSPAFLINAYRSKAFVEFQLGRLSAACRTAETGVEIARAAAQVNKLDLDKPDWALLMLHAIGAWSYCMRGMADKAAQMFDKCSLFESCVGYYIPKGLVLFWIGNVHLIFEQMDEVDNVGKRLIAMGQEKSVIKLEIMGNFFCASAAIDKGLSQLGVEHLNFAIDRYSELSENVLSGEYYLWLSKAYLQLGKADMSLASIENAFADCGLSKMQPYLTAMHVQKALVMETLGEPALNVLKEFDTAARVAESQQADLAKLNSLQMELSYRVDNKLETAPLVKNLRVLTARLLQHGALPATKRVNAFLSTAPEEIM